MTVIRFLLKLLAPLLPAQYRPIAQVLSAQPAPTPKGTVTVAIDETVANLDAKVDHIVVLMLENRSFDHMLGHLSLAGRGDVDGLRAEFSNTYEGRPYPVHHLGQTGFSSEAQDPCHSPGCVDEQVANQMGGFVASYAKYLARHPEFTPPGDPSLVMGYYDGHDLPVYDFLASEFCVCDRWFSSVPGATWPNRLYAVTGRAAGSRENVNPPIYNLPTVMRQLDAFGVPWRSYSFDPSTLRFIDAQYRLTHHQHFAFFDQRKLAIAEKGAGLIFEEGASFLDDAASGNLPRVAWIEPHFKDLAVFGPDSNDDHPPSDVLAGQTLVLDVYHALRQSPAWEKTLLVVTYDEHGGLFDHVVPPAAPDDDPAFRRYGVRVPALVVSPWVQRQSVAGSGQPEIVFDHTSIIKTILTRFCRQGDQIPNLGARTTAARHLGGLLSLNRARTDVPDHDALAQQIANWRNALNAARYAPAYSPTQPPKRLNELQNGVADVTRTLRQAGLPAGQP